ncbi:Protein of unknown function [Pyronema omphalodes CBS 100304]|uniref:Uncharacterized protein n=1 Tax=Pyronema omphalodes (strain CBS 100304) TaxID=1076935 RepID=U4LDZ7_PYROM|nr:Protein of unknown function [Pyronema omphalodes CBS 100304]
MVNGQGRPHRNEIACNSSHLCETLSLAKDCRVIGEINLKPYPLNRDRGFGDYCDLSTLVTSQFERQFTAVLKPWTRNYSDT